MKSGSCANDICSSRVMVTQKKNNKQDTKEVSDTLRVLEHGTLDGKVIYEMKCLYFHEMEKFIFFYI